MGEFHLVYSLFLFFSTTQLELGLAEDILSDYEEI